MDGNNGFGNYSVMVMDGVEIVEISMFHKLADARAFARYWNDRTSYTTGRKTTASIVNANGKYMKVM